MWTIRLSRVDWIWNTITLFSKKMVTCFAKYKFDLLHTCLFIYISNSHAFSHDVSIVSSVEYFVMYNVRWWGSIFLYIAVRHLLLLSYQYVSSEFLLLSWSLYITYFVVWVMYYWYVAHVLYLVCHNYCFLVDVVKSWEVAVVILRFSCSN